MGSCSQDGAATRIPAKEKHVICLCQITGAPECFMRGIKTEQFADALIGLNFLVTRGLVRPANRPWRSRDRSALVHSIPGFYTDLDRTETDKEQSASSKEQRTTP